MPDRPDITTLTPHERHLLLLATVSEIAAIVRANPPMPLGEHCAEVAVLMPWFDGLKAAIRIDRDLAWTEWRAAGGLRQGEPGFDAKFQWELQDRFEAARA